MRRTFAGARSEDDHAIADLHGLLDVVGDEHHRARPLLERRDQLAAHPVARLVVERGERLVHQQHVGLAGEGARDLDALAHATGELVRIVIRELGEARDLEPLGDLGGACPSGARETAIDVLAHGQPRKQPAVLVDRARLPVALRGAARRLEVTSEQGEQRGLAAPRRADADHQLLARDLEVEVVDHAIGPVVEADALEVEHQVGHRSKPHRTDGMFASRANRMSSTMPITPMMIMPQTTRSIRSA